MKSIINNLNQSKSCPVLKKKVSIQKQLVNQEYDTARAIHDRFCKFNIPFNAADSILTVRIIGNIIPLNELWETDLPFKLNNLRWFLTEKGREFLVQARKQFQLNKKRAVLDVNTIAAPVFQTKDAVPQQNNVDFPPVSGYSNQENTEENKTYEKETRTIADFLL